MRSAMGGAVRLVAITTCLAGCGDASQHEVALGTLERERLELIAQASEPLVEVPVAEGQRVDKDQVVARLDDSAAAAQVQAAQADVSAARNRLTELVEGPRGEEILQARARLEGAQSAAASETREYERIRELVERKLTSPSTLDRQRTLRDRAMAERKESQATLRLLLRGTRIEELDQARDAVKRAEAQLAQVQISHDRLTIRAPRAGIIEAMPYELGERPPTGSPVVIMLADGEAYARVYVPGVLRPRVVAGSSAEVLIDGSATPLAGRVRYIAAQASFTPYYALTQADRGRLSYLAEISLVDEKAATYPAGLPVEVRFPADAPRR